MLGQLLRIQKAVHLLMIASEIANRLSAQLVAGSPDTPITGFAALKDAQPGDLSFFGDERYRADLEKTQATVILVPLNWTAFPPNATCIAVENPSTDFSKLADELGKRRRTFRPGIHPTAVIADSVIANRDRICVGANAVIEDGAHIGDGTEIGAGCVVGPDTRIGADCRLFPNVTVNEACTLGDRVILHPGVVVGADGFGYQFEKGRHRKVDQNGIVQVDNDVEIGSNTTIDRARIGKTWIGEGTKIDNLVQIAHNVRIGKHCIIVSQCGIAGSTVIGDYVVMAAQAGVGGHLNIGAQCVIGARAGVIKDLPPGNTSYLGFPAIPAMQERRRLAASKKIPELIDRVRKLEANAGLSASSKGDKEEA